MIDDKELLSPKDDERMLLELAAKAAGYIVKDAGWTDEFLCRMVDVYSDEGEQCHQRWNPLTDDGDALRLAVKLHLDIHVDSNLTEVIYLNQTTEAHLGDPYAATRRAIVIAAAAIGEKL